MSDMNSLKTLLTRLKLSYVDQELDGLLERAKEAKLTHKEFLTLALEREVEERESKRIKIGMSVARFPRVCTLEGFDFSAVPALPPGTIRDLETMDWVTQKKNLFFLGPPGVGKTHLAIALGRKAIEMGHTVVFVTASELMRQLKTAAENGTLEKKLTQYLKPKLLIIDEIGYLPVKAGSAHLFFELVNARYERSSILLTSNRHVMDWGVTFGDPTGVSALLDRLLHHSEVITIRGDSYRLLEKRREGLISKEAEAKLT